MIYKKTCVKHSLATKILLAVASVGLLSFPAVAQDAAKKPSVPALKAPSLAPPAAKATAPAINIPTLAPPKLTAPGQAATDEFEKYRAPELDVGEVQTLKPPSLPDQTPALEAPAVRAKKSEAEIREDAFNAALRGLMPLEPEEIRKLLEHFDATRQAVEIPVHPYPEPEVAVRTIPLDPSVKPEVVKVAAGHVSTVGIFDLTGAPWAIQDMTWAGNFEIVQPEPGGHIVRITPLTDFAYGNISFRLLELNTPITFTLKSSRDKVHYRFDARIPEFGPQSNLPLIQGGTQMAAGDATLASILEGVPPSDSERLDVSGVDGRTSAYRIDSTTYLRTPFTLLSPGWSSSVSSSDGISVYEMGNTPVVLLSDNGQVLRAHLRSKERLQ